MHRSIQNPRVITCLLLLVIASSCTTQKSDDHNQPNDNREPAEKESAKALSIPEFLLQRENERLRQQINVLVSADEAVAQSEDLKADSELDRSYKNAGPDRANALTKARKKEAWKSLKYKLLFGQIKPGQDPSGK